MKIMYALTFVNKDGFRILAQANQGRNHFKTKEEANQHLKAVIQNNSPSTLESIYGKEGLKTLEVRPVNCYDHGDAMGIYFDN
jgi:hypothetical protein